MLDRKLIEKEYGFLGDVIYLDTSKVSMPPLRTQITWKNYIDGYVREYCLNYGTYFQKKLDYAKNEMAKLLDVNPNEIAFTHSASDSMTLLANSYPLQPGDNVVITSEEHPSNAVPWLALKRFGVNIRIVPSNADGFVSAEDVINTIDEKTKIVSTASLFFCSGYAIDIKRIGMECQKRGIVYAVDATQSMGLLKMRPREWGIDYVAGGGHKGLLGTKSIGYAYCSNALAQRMYPYTGSLQSVLNAGRPCHLKDYDEIQWAPGATRLESGNYPFATIEAIGNGASLINELGIENIEAEILSLDAQLRARLEKLPLKILTPPLENRAGMFIIYYPKNAKPEIVEQILWKNRVRATVRFDYIRMSLDFYNSVDQLDRIVDTLNEIASL